jgi:hypothetical protein
MSSSVFPLCEVVARERDWCTTLVDAYGATGVVLSESTLDLRALFVMSKESALATDVLPLRMHEGVLWLASSRPLSPSHVEALAAHARMNVVVVLAAGALLRGAIEAAYGAAARGSHLLIGVGSASNCAELALVRPAASLAFDIERLVASL